MIVYVMLQYMEEVASVIAIMEEVASVHSLLLRGDMEISSSLVLALTISFVYNTSSCTFCSPQCFS